MDLDRVEQELAVVLELDFWVHLSLDQGRRLPAEVEHGEERVANRFQVVLRRLSHTLIVLIIKSLCVENG